MVHYTPAAAQHLWTLTLKRERQPTGKRVARAQANRYRVRQVKLELRQRSSSDSSAEQKGTLPQQMASPGLLLLCLQPAS